MIDVRSDTLGGEPVLSPWTSASPRKECNRNKSMLLWEQPESGLDLDQSPEPRDEQVNAIPELGYLPYAMAKIRSCYSVPLDGSTPRATVVHRERQNNRTNIGSKGDKLHGYGNRNESTCVPKSNHIMPLWSARRLLTGTKALRG